MSATRSATVTSPLGDGALLFLSMSGREALGRPFAYTLDVLAEDDTLDFSQLLGQVVTVQFEISPLSIREYTGYVTELSLVGELGRYVRYRLQLSPWLSLLKHTTNSRIYQNQSVPEVLKLLFREHGFTEFSEALSNGYRTWEYLVQYRESDFNFVSRLMEQEGIYYYFQHQDQKHTLVLADSYSSHQPVPGYEELPYFPPQQGERRERDHIDGWRLSRQIRPGAFVVADFDFEHPRLKLSSQLQLPNDHAKAEHERFDYPGDFRDLQEGEVQARLRLEEQQTDYEVARGSSNARNLRTGALFQLTDFPRDDQNKEYLVTEAQYELRTSDYESLGTNRAEQDYRCEFKAMESRRPFRARRVTRKPIVEGPQTAIVVGDAKQEIWTDEYGRIKVQFHWDRLGKMDGGNACWVRVAQIWAGSGFGGIYIPRIGQEVVVDFLEGDPDRPVVTGCLYNADNKPPYTLPANRTQSGIKSRSTLGGAPDNFNEIRFEDKKGAEELHMQAEKDFTQLVKNDKSTTVKQSRSASVGGSDSVSVGGDRSVSVNGNLSVTVKGGGKSPVHSSLDVTGKHTLHASDTIEVDAPTHIKFECGGSSILIEPGKITFTAGSGAAVVLDANVLAESKPGSRILLDGNAFMHASGGAEALFKDDVVVKSAAETQMTLNANANVKSNGDVTLEGMKVEATGKVQGALKVGSNSVEVSPAGVNVTGATVNVTGQAMVSVAGPVVKIG